MKKPYIICHMVTSLDNKVTGEFLTKKECESPTEVYYQLNRDYRADGFICGRVTMIGSFTGDFYPDLTLYEESPVEDHIVDPNGYLAVCYDRQGRVGWRSGTIKDEDPGYDGSHVVEVLCENVDRRYLTYLKSIGVSYIFAGKSKMDICLSLKKLNKYFNSHCLLLEGGSIINGAFLEADVIDELSLVIAPINAQEIDKPLFFGGDTSGFVPYAENEINSVKVIKYKRKNPLNEYLE
ncbi:MAG: dihydrofolate reductase family protein [Clostridia bacterium]|nr:dihydrofolate reductase family protein [Clostridia bacterium]